MDILFGQGTPNFKVRGTVEVEYFIHDDQDFSIFQQIIHDRVFLKYLSSVYIYCNSFSSDKYSKDISEVTYQPEIYWLTKKRVFFLVRQVGKFNKNNVCIQISSLFVFLGQKIEIFIYNFQPVFNLHHRLKPQSVSMVMKLYVQPHIRNNRQLECDRNPHLI